MVHSFVLFWGPIQHWKTKSIAKTTSLGISNSVRPRPQKNNRILVKVNKKETLFWAQTGSKLPPSAVVAPKDYQKFSDSQVSFSVYFLFLTLPGRITTFFWFRTQLWPFW